MVSSHYTIPDLPSALFWLYGLGLSISCYRFYTIFIRKPINNHTGVILKKLRYCLSLCYTYDTIFTLNSGSDAPHGTTKLSRWRFMSSRDIPWEKKSYVHLCLQSPDIQVNVRRPDFSDLVTFVNTFRWNYTASIIHRCIWYT